MASEEKNATRIKIKSSNAKLKNYKFLDLYNIVAEMLKSSGNKGSTTSKGERKW